MLKAQDERTQSTKDSNVYKLEFSPDTVFFKDLSTPEDVAAALDREEISLVVIKLPTPLNHVAAKTLKKIVSPNGELDLSERDPDACGQLLMKLVQGMSPTLCVDPQFQSSITIIKSVMEFFCKVAQCPRGFPEWGARLVHSAPQLSSRTTTPHIDFFFGLVGLMVIDGELENPGITTRFSPDSNVTNREELLRDWEELSFAPNAFKPNLADPTILIPAPSQSLLIWKSGPHGRVHAGPVNCPTSRITLMMGG